MQISLNHILAFPISTASTDGGAYSVHGDTERF